MNTKNKNINSKSVKVKKQTFSLSKRLNTTSEDLAMLNERKRSTKKEKGNLCDRHMDGD